MAPPVFPANPQSLQYFESHFYIRSDKSQSPIRIMRDNERRCFFARLVNSRKCFPEGEKEALGMSLRSRVIQSNTSTKVFVRIIKR